MGDPVRLIGGPGQEHDIQRAQALIEGLAPEYVLADKAYDADRFHDAILDVGAPRGSSHPSATVASSMAMTGTSIKSAIASSASSTSSSTSAASLPATTSCSSTSWDSSPSQPSPYSCVRVLNPHHVLAISLIRVHKRL